MPQHDIQASALQLFLKDSHILLTTPLPILCSQMFLLTLYHVFFNHFHIELQKGTSSFTQCYCHLIDPDPGF